jgi:hypothetical protein
MHRTHGITAAALAIATAAAPSFARAEGEGHGNPQQEARIERLIEQAIQGNSEADRQEQARIDRLVRQALERAGLAQGGIVEGRAGLLAQSGPAVPRR